MKRSKWILILISVVSLLAVGTLSILAFISFKLRDVKTPLLNYLQSQIDGKLLIGSAELNYFPAGIDLENVQLFAPGEGIPSTSIKRAELRFELIPLIQKKIETRLTILEPEIRLHRGKDGKSNMERIFAPMISGESKERVSKVQEFWWKRLAVNELLIEKAHFVATQEGSKDVTELRDVTVEAEDIRFESAKKPAKLKIRYELPRVSKEPMELKTKLFFEETQQSLRLEEGKLTWGAAQIHIGGTAGMPVGAGKEVPLNLNFNSDPIDLRKLSKILVDPIPASGTVRCQGTVTGTAFAPVLAMTLDSPSLNVSGKNLSNLHAEIIKKEKPLEIKNTSFGIYGGTVGISGQALPANPTSATLNIALKSLSLAAMSGSKTPARLSGNLQMSSPNVNHPGSFAGGGKITVGPIPLPVMDMRNKIRLAEVLSAGTAFGRMVNVGMLSSSANVIGTQVDQVHASVRIAGGNITLSPFSLGNGHFSASGTGTIHQQKSINAAGTFTLNRGVTAQLITDPGLRQILTKGSGSLSFPFSMSGPLANPNVSVNSSHLKELAGKAAALGIANMLAGGVRPADMLNQALKNTPVGDPKNPLGQILGGVLQPPQNPQPQTTSARPKTTSTTTQKRTTTTQPSTTTPKKSPLEQLLFGN